MGLMEQAKTDIEQITGNLNEFAMSLTFAAPTGDTATITGIYSDHSNTYDANGFPVVGRFAHVSISEKALTDLNYPTRNNDGTISMLNHLVTVNYADGSTKQSIIDEVKPDYTINLIVLILSRYNGTN
jgi:hypothetical protein